MADSQVRNLFNHTTTATNGNHKDKLAATKAAERDLHDALKAQERAAKEKRTQEAAASKELLKEERLTHDTKRAAKDKREMEKRANHKETGQACEHGVWRCKICFPHGDHRGDHHQ